MNREELKELIKEMITENLTVSVSVGCAGCIEVGLYYDGEHISTGEDYMSLSDLTKEN